MSASAEEISVRVKEINTVWSPAAMAQDFQESVERFTVHKAPARAALQM